MGQRDGWKFAKDVAAQRADSLPLREQLLWRIGALTSAQSVDLAQHAAHFPEVIAGLTVPESGIRPILVSRDKEGELISKASLEDGGSLVATGFLQAATGEFVGSFKRRLQFEQSWALHEQLVIVPEFRGRGIAPSFLLRSFGLYDDLELEEVHLVAGLETGRWYWAHMGFDFMKVDEKAMVRYWAEEVCAALGVDGSEIGEQSSAGQIARLDCESEISLAALSKAMPHQHDRLEEIAEKNGMEMTRPISLGRAIMLTGPQWSGFLQLKGPHRLAFEEAAQERAKRAAEGGQGDHPPAAGVQQD